MNDMPLQNQQFLRENILVKPFIKNYISSNRYGQTVSGAIFSNNSCQWSRWNKDDFAD